MSLFTEHVTIPVKAGLNKPDQGIPIPLEKLSKYINYIERGKINVVGGKEATGKTSLMDYMYFINVFRWWRELDENARPPLRMIYFSMRNKPRIKIQKWLCLYLKLEFDMVVDIPTLNNLVGRLYELDEDDKMNIMAAHEFFDELEENLILVNGSQTPSAIHNRIQHYMNDIGTIDDSGTFIEDENVHNPAAFVELTYKGELVYRGWLYQEFPELFGPDTPGWKLWLKAVTVRAPSEEGIETQGSLSSAG